MNNWIDHIFFHLRTQPERPAIVMEERVVTYAMLRAAVERCARRVAGLGRADGAPVAILVANPVRHVALIFALLRAGIPSISLEHGQAGVAAFDFAAVLGDDKARALVNPATRFVEVTDEWFSSEAEGAAPHGFADSTQVCRFNLSSGTTGQPKLAKVRIDQVGVRLGGYTGFSWNSLLCPVGMSSNWTFMAICATFVAGRTICFSASTYQTVRMIELFGIDYLMASTEQMVSIARVARKTGALLPSLRLAEVAGSVPTAALLEAAMIHVCRQLYVRYGATEIGVVSRATAQDVLSRPGFVGQLFPGIEIGIADAAGKPCPPGVVGTVRGRQDLRWYAPESRGTIDNPWIDVSDLGWMSAEGELYVTGRPSDSNAAFSPNIAQRQISPVHEVEHLLRLEWDAADAAAILVDEKSGAGRGEIWIAAVDCKDARAEKLEAILRARGLDHAVRLFALPFIPRGTNGKVQRERLTAAMIEAARGVTPSRA